MITRLALLALSLGSAAQDGKPAEAPKAQQEIVRVPIYPNVSCPIMGKPISTRLFTDTSFGRIWICCKSCVEDIQAEVEVSYRAAYPTKQRIENELSPVSGKPVPEEDPVRIELQGFEFALFDDREVALAREHAQVVLARLKEPKLVDLDNKTCPVTGKPTVPNAFVVIESTIVRLSSPKLLEQVQAAHSEILRKAREISAEERAARPVGEDAR